MRLPHEKGDVRERETSGYGGDKRWQALWRKSVVRVEQPLQLEQRFVVKGNCVESIEARAGVVQTEAHRVSRKARVVLLSGKALFLRGGDNFTIFNDRRGGVMIES